MLLLFSLTVVVLAQGARGIGIPNCMFAMFGSLAVPSYARIAILRLSSRFSYREHPLARATSVRLGATLLCVMGDPCVHRCAQGFVIGCLWALVAVILHCEVPISVY